jgi:hypothetical protein
MFKFDTPASSESERERFETAFYRFLKLNDPPTDEAAWLESVVEADGERLVAQFWCPDVALRFEEFLSTFKLSGGGRSATWRSEHAFGMRGRA